MVTFAPALAQEPHTTAKNADVQRRRHYRAFLVSARTRLGMVLERQVIQLWAVPACYNPIMILDRQLLNVHTLVLGIICVVDQFVATYRLPFCKASAVSIST